MKKFMLRLIVVAGLMVFGGLPAAAAATSCTFTTSGTKMKLDADCTTDATIFIPDGFTLDGNGYTITAVDPPGDHFRGAVVQNGGATAHVKDLIIETNNLASVCDGGADRLRGILFDGASGTIEQNIVLNLNQGNSDCQEGNAIEVRNAPFDGSHPDTQTVTISDNVVRAYQKTGIVANGDVQVTIEENTVVGLGPINFIAQNGIQLGFGALGEVEDNEISDNIYTPQTFASGGILIFAAGDGPEIKDNKVDANDVGIWLISTDGGSIKKNEAENSTFDGIALDDQAGGTVSDHEVKQNELQDNDVGIGLYGSGVSDNLVEKNEAEKNASAGFFAGFGATGNTFSRNKAKRNNAAGYQIESGGNTLTRNKAEQNGGSGFVDHDGVTSLNVLTTKAAPAGGRRAPAVFDGDERTVREVTRADNLAISSVAVRNTYSDNDAKRNAGHGFVAASNGNVFEGNDADKNQGDGFRVPGDDNYFAGNEADENDGDGFFVGEAASGNIFEGNEVKESGGDGFDVGGDDNTFTGNEADENGGDGFYVTGASNIFEDNGSHDNQGYGYRDAGSGNAFTANTCEDNDAGPSDPPGLCAAP